MKIRDPQTSVGTLISDAFTIKVRENRMYVGQIIEILRFTAVQGIAQRGNDETKDSENRGNFLELLQLISKNNPIVENKLKEGPKNAKYTHPSIQNEILNVLASATLEVVSKQINSAVYFSIMADETKDVSKTEQLSVIVRFYLKFMNAFLVLDQLTC